MSEVIQVQGKRLGRLAPIHDPERLSLHRYTNLSALPTAPPEWNETGDLATLGTMLNTVLGCCTCSTAGHWVQFWTALADGLEVTVPDSAIEALYELAGGYVPGDPSTDNGAVISTVLSDLRSTGIGGHKIGAYASVPLSAPTLAQQAMWIWGGLDAGWNMPSATQSMTGVWDVPEGQPLTGNYAPGSWGGHSTLVAGFLANGNWLACSWGEWFEVTPAFVAAYLEELWVAVSPDWLEANGTSPDGGFDTAQLDQDLSELSDEPTPTPQPTPPSPEPSIITELKELVTDVEHTVERIIHNL